MLTGNTVETLETKLGERGWFIVKLGPKYSVSNLTKYTLGYYRGGAGYVPRNWELQASNDGTTWVTLLAHKQDTSLSEQHTSHTWKIPAVYVDKQFTYLQLMTTGKNTSNNEDFAASGFEVYGTLIINE